MFGCSAAEIPLFHVLTARITFGNIFAVDDPVANVSVLQEDDRLTCLVDDAVFEPPAGYRSVGETGTVFTGVSVRGILECLLECR